MKLTNEQIESELLYHVLTNLGQCYPLDKKFNLQEVKSHLKKFENNWQQYNPRKPRIRRYGLSAVSLDGGLSGVPDLDSVSEYNKEHGTSFDETSFRVPTPVLTDSSEISEVLSDFIPHLGRSHFIKLNEGGFFPYHRDALQVGAKTFRLISLIQNCGVGQFCLLYENQRLLLEPGRLYFLNTKAEHAVFSFGKNSIFLVLNVILSPKTIDLIIGNLLAK